MQYEKSSISQTGTFPTIRILICIIICLMMESMTVRPKSLEQTKEEHKAVIKNKFHSPYKINEMLGKNLPYGDILLSPKIWKKRREKGKKKGAALLKPRYVAIKNKSGVRWPGNRIPYAVSKKYSSIQRKIITGALKTLERKSCFQFVRRRNQQDFIYFDMLDGCYSYVGRIGGQQLLSLGPDCLHDNIIQHEVMHALGLEHEHQRPDRDKYIEIRYTNVEPDKKMNFDKLPLHEVELLHAIYDYKSLMHYDKTAFGKVDPRTGELMETMAAIKDGVELTDNTVLSSLDVEKLRILGKCNPGRKGKKKQGVVKPIGLFKKIVSLFPFPTDNTTDIDMYRY